MRHPIRNFKEKKQIPSRFCDVIIENGRVDLEVKNSKKELVRIAWDDVKKQVAEAIKESKEIETLTTANSPTYDRN